jgi:hypothetical protein
MPEMPVTVAQLYQLCHSRSSVYGKVEYANFAIAECRSTVVRQPGLMALVLLSLDWLSLDLLTLDLMTLILLKKSQLSSSLSSRIGLRRGALTPYRLEASAVELEQSKRPKQKVRGVYCASC